MRRYPLYIQISFGFAAVLLVSTALVAALLSNSSTRNRIVDELMAVSLHRVHTLGNLELSLQKWNNDLRGYALGGPGYLLMRSQEGRADVMRRIKELSEAQYDLNDARTNSDLEAEIRRLEAVASRVPSLSRGGVDSPAFSLYQREMASISNRVFKLIENSQGQELLEIRSLEGRFHDLGYQTRIISTWGAIFGLILAIMLAIVSTRAITGPIRRLVALSQDAAQGNYSLVERIRRESGGETASSRNEVALLAQAFSAMVAAVEAREARLRADADIREICLSSNRASELLERVLERLAFHTRSTSAIAYIVGEPPALNPVAGYNIPGNLQGYAIELGEGAIDQAIAQRKCMLIADESSGRIGLLRSETGETPASIVVAPLIIHDQPVGMLCLGSGRYSSTHLEFLDGVLGHISLATGNAIAFARIEEIAAQLQAKNEALDAQNEELQAQSEEIQAQNEEIRTQNEELCERQSALDEAIANLHTANRELAALQAIGNVALSSLDMETLLDQMLAAVVEAAGGDMGSVFLLDEDEDTLSIYVLHGEVPSIARGYQIRLGEGMAGQVAQARQVMQVSGARLSSLSTYSVIRRCGIQSLLGIPLIARDRLLGVIEVSITQERHFSHREIGLLKLAADRISTAIDRARAFSEMDLQRRRLEAILSDLPEGVVIVSAPDGKPLLINQVAKELYANVDFDAAIPDHARVFGLYRPNGEVFPPEELPVSRSLLKGEFVRDVEILIRHADGREIGVIANSSPIYDDQGRINGAVGVFGDISAIQEERERQRHIADTLQQSLLPRISGELPGCLVAHLYQAGMDEAKVGGDFYDLFSLGNHKLGVIIGDVSGKGLPAAIHTAMIKYSLRSYATVDPNPRQVLRRLNETLCRDHAEFEGFATLFYGVIDLEKRHLLYTSAGHEPPIHVPMDGNPRLLDGAGVVLGIDPLIDYPLCEASLQKGDTLLLYTDGLSEARKGNAFLEHCGIQRLLLDALHSSELPDDVVDRVYRGAKEFAGGKLHDDVAILLVQMMEEA